MQDQLTFPGNKSRRFRGWSRLLSRATTKKLLSSDESSSIDCMVRGRDCSRGLSSALRSFVLVLLVWNVVLSPGLARAQQNLNSQSELSSRDWQGSWNLQFEYQGQWHSSHLVMTASEDGIQGDYEYGRLRGTFDRSDISIATGQTENTTGSGRTCASGKQTGAFSLTLGSDGKSMNGWWDVCNSGPKYRWKAQKETRTRSGSQSGLSSRDWQGSWDLQFEYQGQWHSSRLAIRAGQAGIQGDYESGRLRGVFDPNDVSIVTGQTENTTATGRACASGKQTGAFSLTLASDGNSMNGWWDVCNSGPKYQWRAQKQN